MSFTPSTQLAAVNIILSTIGEAPVNTLIGTLPLSASIASAALNEQANAVQLDGYWYNTDRRRRLISPAMAFAVFVSATVMRGKVPSYRMTERP